MSRIFISYKRVDKDKVFKIKDQIESALGEKCWIDLDGIESDAQFKNIIIKAINECEVVLFMYSKAHTQIIDYEKDWTLRELNFAASKEKRIVFINIDGSELIDQFEFRYGTKQQVDATSGEAINKLCEDLERRLFPERIAERERKREKAEKEALRKLKEEKEERIRREAEEKARKEAEEMARKEKEAKALEEKKKQSIAKVHLCIDANSLVYYSNKEIARCSANEDVVIELPYGEQNLKIVSIEDNSVKKQLSVNVNCSTLTVDEVKIAPIIKRKKTIARKKKEEEDRRKRDEEYRREQIAIKVQEQRRLEEAGRKQLEEDNQWTELLMSMEKERKRQERSDQIVRFRQEKSNQIKGFAKTTTKTIFSPIKSVRRGFFSLVDAFDSKFEFCTFLRYCILYTTLVIWQWKLEDSVIWECIVTPLFFLMWLVLIDGIILERDCIKHDEFNRGAYEIFMCILFSVLTYLCIILNIGYCNKQSPYEKRVRHIY